MRRVAIGGILGGLPGMLIALVPLVLADLDIITGDQSQIGFIGLPVLVIGTLIGTLMGGSGTSFVNLVAVGVIIGFVVGLAGGLGLVAALRAIDLDVPGLWVFTTPAAMIAGGVLGVWWGRRKRPGPAPAQREQPFSDPSRRG